MRTPAALSQRSVQSPFADILENYKVSLQSQNRSPKTITWYLDILRRYFDYLETNGLLKPLRELGRNDLRLYQLHQQSRTRWTNRPGKIQDARKLSPYSIQGHVRAIKAFWSWLLAEGYVKENPLAKFPLPRVPQTVIKVITPQQFSTIIQGIDRNTPRGAQYYSILLALFDSGSRISELLNVRFSDIDLNTGAVRVLGKGQKERMLALTPQTMQEIRRYVKTFRPQICRQDTPYLFCDAHGRPKSINSVEQYMRRLVLSGKLTGTRFHPHLLRHSFATFFLNAGGNVFFLKEIMGHSSLATTLRYTHLKEDDVRREHNKFSPMSNINLLRPGER